MTGYCPKCDGDRALRPERRRETRIVRGDAIEVEVEVLVCATCGIGIAEPERDDQTLRAIYDEYRRRHGMLFPEQIKGLRERYGLSQRGLSRLLGWGEITIHRYESGSLQDAAHDQVLQQLNNPEFVLDLLSRYGDRLTIRERQTVQAAALGRSEPAQNTLEVIEGRIGSRYSIDGLERGFRPLDFERVGAVIQWYAFHAADLFKTKLAKLLWLADFAHFRSHRLSITGMVYARGPYGPVPDKLGTILDALEDEGVIKVNEFYAGSYEGELVSVREPLPMDLDAEELQTLEKVQRAFGHCSSKELSDLSHQENAWILRGNGEPIPYTEADRINLLSSL